VEEVTKHQRGRDAIPGRQAMAILMNRYNAQVTSLIRKAANTTALAVLAVVIGAIIAAPAFASLPSADRSGGYFSAHEPVSGAPSNNTPGSSAASATATAILSAHETAFLWCPKTPSAGRGAAKRGRGGEIGWLGARVAVFDNRM